MGATEFWGRIRRIHESPLELVLVVTGGGSGAIAALLHVPGASRTVLEALVPYSPPAMAALLGAPPEKACSAGTARAMAMAAFQRARHWHGQWCGTEKAHLVAGISCTASLATDRPKRGPHRIHLAAQTLQATEQWSCRLVKGARDRQQEEAVAQEMVLTLIEVTAGLRHETVVEGLRAEELLERQRVDAPQVWRELVRGARQAVCHGPQVPDGCTPRLVFPGAFNPRHEGHLRMARWAQQHYGAPVQYEIAINNVDKPMLDYIEIQRRLQQFGPDETVWLTTAATFRDKAALFPGAMFLVGADTMARIADMRYYQGPEDRRKAFRELEKRGCRFLVFGRCINGVFRTLDQLALPPALRRLCVAVPANEFRQDICSTELRARQQEED